MYKITEVREVSTLPEDIDESHHLSSYILTDSKGIDKENTNYRREHYSIYRTTDRSVTMLKINGKEVWCKTEEYNRIKHILPEVKDNQILLWYVAGSIAPTVNDNGILVKASAVDGYEVHIAYNI